MIKMNVYLRENQFSYWKTHYVVMFSFPERKVGSQIENQTSADG